MPYPALVPRAPLPLALLVVVPLVAAMPCDDDAVDLPVDGLALPLALPLPLPLPARPALVAG